MNIGDFKRLDPFHQEVILILERIAKALEHGLEE